MTEPAGDNTKALSSLAAPYNRLSPAYWAAGAPGNAPISIVAREVQRLSRTQTSATVLDLGFGKGAHWQGAVLPDNVTLTAVDMSAEWLNEAITPRPAETVLGLVPEVLSELPSRSYDLVMAFDLIEHLPRHEGVMMLYEMQRIAASVAIIFTPNGLVWQPPSIDNRYNAHISGWTPRELRAMGWTETYGWGGFRALKGPYAQARLHPKTPIGRKAAYLASLVGRTAVVAPSMSFSFTAVVRTGITGHNPIPADAWDNKQ